MLKITIPGREYYDERTNEFVTKKAQTVTLEHSLISMSKWEGKWRKPLLKFDQNRTWEETIDYIRCMTLTPNVDPTIYYSMSDALVAEVDDYIQTPQTATTFREDNAKGGSRRIVTSEVLYCWMTLYNIPFSCEKWHLSKLIALIRVCELETSPKKKMKKKDVMARNAALNKARREKYRSSG